MCLWFFKYNPMLQKLLELHNWRNCREKEHLHNKNSEGNNTNNKVQTIINHSFITKKVSHKESVQTIIITPSSWQTKLITKKVWDHHPSPSSSSSSPITVTMSFVMILSLYPKYEMLDYQPQNWWRRSRELHAMLLQWCPLPPSQSQSQMLSKTKDVQARSTDFCTLHKNPKKGIWRMMPDLWGKNKNKRREREEEEEEEVWKAKDGEPDNVPEYFRTAPSQWSLHTYAPREQARPTKQQRTSSLDLRNCVKKNCWRREATAARQLKSLVAQKATQ